EEQAISIPAKKSKISLNPVNNMMYMEMRLFIELSRKNNMRVFLKYQYNTIHNSNLCLTSIKLFITKYYGVTIKLIVK
ncbi:hypothetical protein, partial [Bifidobacterium sp. M0353]|uniref:hypothetical protein n=1 Tax=Bifidobacterium sp. M0353 TaxID=2751006 RepID=UPI001E30A8C9